MSRAGRVPLLVLALACARAEPEGPPPVRWDSGSTYVDYLRRAPEFQPVKQDPAVGRWDTWLYMPWRYRWTIGTGEEGGRFCQRYGINGGFTDHGEGPFAWL